VELYESRQAIHFNKGGWSVRNPNPGRRVVGGRVYDSEKGTTCHQCRQKTLDHKVSCTNTIIDPKTGRKTMCTIKLDEMCLTGRYGETIEEVSIPTPSQFNNL